MPLALLVLALSSFAIGTTEFVIMRTFQRKRAPEICLVGRAAL